MIRAPLSVLIIIFCACSTPSDSEDFENCLEANQLAAYLDLEKACDSFIKNNYWYMNLDDGYRSFLDEYDFHWKNSWIIDTVEIKRVNEELKNAFGNHYDAGSANFLPLCSLTLCLEKSSNERFIRNYMKEKTKYGSPGPNLVASQMKVDHVTPKAGLMKTLFMTVVLFRLLHMQSQVKMAVLRPVEYSLPRAEAI